MKTFIMSAAVALAAAAPALAQSDAGATAVPPAAGPSGSELIGFRLEGDLGGDRFQSQGTHRDKFGYGGAVGFDGRVGERFVVGPELSYWRSNDFTEIGTRGVVGGTVYDKSFGEIGAAVRAGILINPNLLLFGKGGYVNNFQRKSFIAPANQTSYYYRLRTDGYQVGGGAELSMGSRFTGVLSGLYVNAQYVHSQYDDHTSRQRVLAGIGIHFK